MVAHLQHVGLPIKLLTPVVQHIVFRLRLHVAGEQECGFPIVHLQDDGGVVGLGVGLYRPQHRDLRLPQRKLVTGGGNGNFQTLLVGVVDKFVKNIGGIGLCGGVHRFGGVHRQHSRQAAYMILVGVGAHHGFQLLHALLLQVRNHQLAVVPVAAVNEQKLPITFQKRAVCLSHVDELNGQPSVGDGGLCRQSFRAAAQKQGQGQQQSQ